MTTQKVKMAFNWSEYLQEMLLEFVEGYPSLWDKSNANYSRVDKNNIIWSQIGKNVGCTGEEAQHQFGLLKRRYVRHKEKILTGTRSGAAAPSHRVKHFFLAEKIAFLDPVMKRRRTVDSFSFPIPPQPPSSPQPSTSTYIFPTHSSVPQQTFYSHFIPHPTSLPIPSPPTPYPTSFPVPSPPTSLPVPSPPTSLPIPSPPTPYPTSFPVPSPPTHLPIPSPPTPHPTSLPTPSPPTPHPTSLPIPSPPTRSCSSNSVQQTPIPMPSPSTQPTQASRIRQTMLDESTAAFQAIRDAATAISRRTVTETNNPADLYQRKVTEFVSFAAGTLPEEKKKKFLDKILEVYLEISRE